jgi:hypothetical protein
MRMTGTFLNRAARIGRLLMGAAVLLGHAPAAHAAAGNTGLKIYEIDGAGALSGATYRQDTIVLFNPTQASITCTGCAIQTHSGTAILVTTTWTVYKLPTFTIPAGGWYMISGSSPNLATFGSLSPIPYDYELQTIEDGSAAAIPSTQNILSSTTGAVALTSTQTALTPVAGSLCGSGTQLLDLVGYGSDIATNAATTATPSLCFAGTGEAYYDGSTAYGRQLGVTRKNKCSDTFDNSVDFINIAPTFFNSSSARSVCPTGTQLSAVVSASPSNPGVTETVTFKAVVTPATVPNSTGITAFLHFDSPYYTGAALQMYDDGTHGDAVAGDGVYTLTTSIASNVLSGFTYATNITVSDALGNSFTGSTRLSITTGAITMTTPTNTGTVTAGGVLTFPITITGLHGYGGVLNITCTGSPNTNSLGVPISTQCVSTPPELTIAANGTGTLSLAIATGTTHPAGGLSPSPPLALIGILSIVLLTVGVWRRKHLLAVSLMALVMLMTFNITACSKDAGIGNTSAAPGVYTYTVTATDSNIATVTNSVMFTITVQ